LYCPLVALLRSILMEPQTKPTTAVQELVDPAQKTATAITVAATAIGLLAVFLINLISGALPLKLLDPQWQLRVILQLISNVTFPLVAFMLICLAPQIDPSLALLQRWRQRSQTLALGAVLLFLLIIPLQAHASWKVIRQAKMEQATQLQNDQRQFAALQQAIEQATTMDDLQSRMRALDGPVLGLQDQAQPLEKVRQQLMQALVLARSNNRSALASLPPDQVLAQVLNTVQISCSSLAMALCFAAGARRPGSRRTLLLQAIYQGRQWLMSRNMVPPTEAGQSLQERQRASEKQKKLMNDSRKRAMKEQQERERQHKQRLAKWGKQRNWF
jgi:hypothetical protein